MEIYREKPRRGDVRREFWEVQPKAEVEERIKGRERLAPRNKVESENTERDTGD